MKIFDKVKNLFTEEVEEEKEIKREVRRVEIPSARRVEIPTVRQEKIEEPIISDVKPAILETPTIKEDKSLFFDDKDFEDLEKEVTPVKIEKKEEPKPYNGTKVTVQPVEEKKVFKPTPIISPVYGVLDKNYKKEDIIPYTKPSRRSYYNENITVDDVRKRAFSSLEDDIKNDLFTEEVEEEPTVIDDLNIFSEENDEDLDNFGIEDEKTPKINSEMEFNFDDETELLAKQLEEQKKKLDEINELINDNSISKPKSVKNVDEYLYQDKIQSNIDEDSSEDLDDMEEELENKNLDEVFIDAMDDIDEATKKTPKSENEAEERKSISESELFDLIDSMYEKGDEIDD